MAIIDLNNFTPSVRADNRQRQEFYGENAETLKGIGKFSERLLDTTVDILAHNRKIEKDEFRANVLGDFDKKSAEFDANWDATIAEGGYMDRNNQTYLTSKMKFYADFRKRVESQNGGTFSGRGLVEHVSNDLTNKITNDTVGAIKTNYAMSVKHVTKKFGDNLERMEKDVVEMDFKQVQEYYAKDFMNRLNEMTQQTRNINPVMVDSLVKNSREKMAITIFDKVQSVDLTSESAGSVIEKMVPLKSYVSKEGRGYRYEFLKESRYSGYSPDDLLESITNIYKSDLEMNQKFFEELEDLGIDLGDKKYDKLKEERSSLQEKIKKVMDAATDAASGREPVSIEMIDGLIDAYGKEPILDMDDIDIEGRLDTGKQTATGTDDTKHILWDNLPAKNRTKYFSDVYSIKLAGTTTSAAYLRSQLDAAKAISLDMGTRTTTIDGLNRVTSGPDIVKGLLVNPDNQEHIAKNPRMYVNDLYQSLVDKATYMLAMDPSKAKNIEASFENIHRDALNEIAKFDHPLISKELNSKTVGTEFRKDLKASLEKKIRDIGKAVAGGKINPAQLAAIYGSRDLQESSLRLSKDYSKKNVMEFERKFNSSLGDYMLGYKSSEASLAIVDAQVTGLQTQIEAVNAGVGKFGSFTELYLGTLGQLQPEMRGGILERGYMKGGEAEKQFYLSAIMTDFFSDNNEGAFLGDILSHSSPQATKAIADTIKKDPKTAKAYATVKDEVVKYINSNLSSESHSRTLLSGIGTSVSNYLIGEFIRGGTSDATGIKTSVSEVFEKLYSNKVGLNNDYMKGIIKSKPGEDKSQLKKTIQTTHTNMMRDLESGKIDVNLGDLHITDSVVRNNVNLSSVTVYDKDGKPKTVNAFSNAKNKYDFLKTTYDFRLQPLDDSGKTRTVEAVMIDRRTKAVIRLRDSKKKLIRYEVP